MSNRGFLWILLGAVAECGWAYGLKHAANLGGFLLTTALVSISFISFIAEIISDYAANGALPNFIRLFFIATLILGVLGLKRAKQ